MINDSAIPVSRPGTDQSVVGGGREFDAAGVIGVLLLGGIVNLFIFKGQISLWWQLVLRGVILLFVLQNRLTKLK